VHWSACRFAAPRAGGDLIGVAFFVSAVSDRHYLAPPLLGPGLLWLRRAAFFCLKLVGAITCSLHRGRTMVTVPSGLRRSQAASKVHCDGAGAAADALLVLGSDGTGIAIDLFYVKSN
jgi:hypothetical protein